MKLVPKIIRRATAFRRKHGFWALIKAGVAYLWNGYKVKRYRCPFSLKTKTVGQGMKIFYIDYFSPRNSNLYWLRAFQKFGEVKTFDIVRENKELLKDRIMDFGPVHIHLGGSVKDNMVSPQLLADIKNELKCTISVFYGDCEYSPYHCQLAESADYIYISNSTHIKVNEEKGYNNFKYMPCPTDSEIFNYTECQKRYDLVFIGNNNQPERLPLLKSLSSTFNLKVFGSGWEKTGLNYSRPVYGERFNQACNAAKICLAIVEPKCANLEAYFSNRLVNTLATRSFCIQTYTPGLEGVFINHKHLVWYTSTEQLFQLVQNYLGNEAEREKIAASGQKEVYKKYTYGRSVERILKDSEKIANRFLYSELDEDWQNALANEITRGGERFTPRWYQNHPITKELLKCGVLQGLVLDLGCGIGIRAFLAQEQSGTRITGIDGSQYAIKYAINNFGSSKLDFLCGDLTRMPFKDGSFDNAYMLAVIEHIADTDTLLSEIKRVVKQRGKLFLSVTERNYHSDPSHLHIFTTRNLKSALEGFRLLNLYVKEHIIFTTVEI